MTLKTNLVAWHATSNTTVKSLYDGTTQSLTPPTGTGTLWGAALGPHSGETLAQAFTRFETAIGATCQVARAYDSSQGPSKVLSVMQGIGLGTRPGMVPSFRLDPSSVANGTYDATITSFFQALPTNKLTYWSYWHEFDGPNGLGKSLPPFTLAQFQAAWKRCKQLADAVGNPQSKATLIFTGFSFTGSSGRLAQYYPGVAGYVDVVACDPYALASTPNEDVQTLCEPLYDDVVALGGPKFGIAEIGTRARSSGTSYVTNFVASLPWLEGKAEFVTYYNAVANGFDYEIDDIPAAAADYGAIVNS